MIPRKKVKKSDTLEKELGASKKGKEKELEDHIQGLVRDSDQERNRFFLYKVMPEFEKRTWSSKAYHPYYSPDHFVKETIAYRKYFQEDIIGKFEDKLLPPNPQTRKIYDKERWSGYEVVLEVYPHLMAAGMLLIPKDKVGAKMCKLLNCFSASGIFFS